MKAQVRGNHNEISAVQMPSEAAQGICRRIVSMGSASHFLVKLWHATQVEMHGQHSTQRVLELTKYANETSWLRVITILLVTPLPCLVVTVLVDILPLADPSEGLEGNKMYLVRLFYTFMRTIRNTVFISGLCVGVYYGLATAIGFPLPFMLMTLTPIWTSFVAISLAVGWKKKLKETPGAGKMLVNSIKLWMCEALLVFTYPVYYYIFSTLSRKGKTAFALLLPVIKLVMKNIIARSVVHLIDEMPEVVVFNAEVFNALFVSYCMQNSPSVWITLEMMVFDALMMAFSLRGAGNSRRSLKELERRIDHERSWGSFRDRANSTRGCASLWVCITCSSKVERDCSEELPINCTNDF
ncbi:hypothetical protein PR002_g3744 [Phytophthora rubi]|uniref:Uncharacterized protein n=1 Tax=Phytophthora rubi TaxID=129364 RepID=A0A6A3NNV1_9STRA|nr:hypothetical protein PR002_g3744 [Phytophthora rubi]